MRLKGEQPKSGRKGNEETRNYRDLSANGRFLHGFTYLPDDTRKMQPETRIG
jgi:hypothetical protein